MVSLTPTEEIEEFVQIAKKRLVFKLLAERKYEKYFEITEISNFENYIEEKILDTRTTIISTSSNKEGCVLPMMI